MTTVLQRSDEDIVKIVLRFRQIKNVDFDLTVAGIPSET